MKITIIQSQDPRWPKWGVAGMGSQTKWYDTEEEARLAVAAEDLLEVAKAVQALHASTVGKGLLDLNTSDLLALYDMANRAVAKTKGT